MDLQTYTLCAYQITDRFVLPENVLTLFRKVFTTHLSTGIYDYHLQVLTFSANRLWLLVITLLHSMFIFTSFRLII